MPLPQHLTYGYGGNVYLDLPARHSNAQVRIITGDGDAICNPVTATLSTVSTVLNVAASKGQYGLNVLSNTGIAQGVRVWLQDDPEEVLVRSVSGGTVALRRPLIYDHANSATVQGTRMHYAVNGASANTLFWYGHCDWNIDGGALLIQTGVECSKYPTAIGDVTGDQDLFDEEPRLYDIIDREEDLDRMRERGADEVYRRIAKAAPDQRVRVLQGSAELKTAVVLACWMIFYRRQPGAEAQTLYDRYSKALDDELTGILPMMARDADQDGAPASHERISYRTVHLRK